MFSLADQCVGEQIFRFPDESELLLKHEGGALKVSLSPPYQLRLALEAKAAVRALHGSAPRPTI